MRMAERPGNRPLALWLSLYALSGFVALSLEIVWFRLLGVMLRAALRARREAARARAGAP